VAIEHVARVEHRSPPLCRALLATSEVRARLWVVRKGVQASRAVVCVGHLARYLGIRPGATRSDSATG
jgi:hypothetical protein